MITKTNIQDQVYAELRKQIIQMELLPGTSISVYDISDRLGVSRTPVREAFIRLSGESLVEVHPQRKTQISRISMKRVYQECFLRTSLERSVLVPFIEIRTDTHIDAMQKLLDRQIAYAEQGMIAECLNVDDAFHHVAFVVTSQLLSWKAIEQTNGHYRRMRFLTLKDSYSLAETFQHHKQIIEAVKTRDVAAAQNVLGIHCRIASLKAQWPDYFVDE